jgi:hypothetical protein
MSDVRVDLAKRLRRQATALRRTAHQLDVEADTLELDFHANAQPLSGQQIVDALADHVQVGEEAHYRTFYELLAARGHVPRGERPMATLRRPQQFRPLRPTGLAHRHLPPRRLNRPETKWSPGDD